MKTGGGGVGYISLKELYRAALFRIAVKKSIWQVSNSNEIEQDRVE